MGKHWTHAELCKKAVAWLKRPHSAGGPGCPNALSEVKSGSNGGEIPDAIGLKTAEGTESIVIEAKTSRADFLADSKKPFRRSPEMGMGNFRYFICPEGLLSAHELPERWGLLEVNARGKITVVCGHVKGGKESWWQQSNRDAELGMASLQLARAGDLEQLNTERRCNARLEKELRELRQKLEPSPQEFIDALDSLVPIARAPSRKIRKE